MLEDGEWDWYSEKRRRRGSMEYRDLRGNAEGRPRRAPDVVIPEPSYLGTEEDPLDVTPMQSRGFLSARTKSVLVWLLLLLGLVTELVLAWVGYYLVDLSLDLMEVWVQLARKHLEITL